MKIYVIRHGLTPLNKAKKVNGQIDEPLAPEGIEQAKQTVSTIPITIRNIYSSSLLRAQQTAEIINSELNLPLSFRNELSEINMGSLAGKSWEEMESGMELKQKHRTVKFDYTPFGGESVTQVKERLTSFLEEINKKHEDSEVLIITHGGMIRVLQLLYKGESSYETEKNTALLTFDIG